MRAGDEDRLARLERSLDAPAPEGSFERTKSDAWDGLSMVERELVREALSGHEIPTGPRLSALGIFERAMRDRGWSLSHEPWPYRGGDPP